MPEDRELLEIQNEESDATDSRTKKTSLYAYDDVNLTKKRITGTTSGNKFKLDVKTSVDTSGLATEAKQDVLENDKALASKQLPDGHNVTVLNPTADPETGLAKEAKQDTLIAKDFATSTKQDIAKTVLDNIKTNTDNLTSDPATASNQETVYPDGTGSNGSVTLTLANTAYAIPSTASTEKHILVLYNGGDTDIYWGFANSNANGILLPPDGRASLNLGANQQVYAYCASAGKIITYSYKNVK